MVREVSHENTPGGIALESQKSMCQHLVPFYTASGCNVRLLGCGRGHTPASHGLLMVAQQNISE